MKALRRNWVPMFQRPFSRCKTMAALRYFNEVFKRGSRTISVGKEDKRISLNGNVSEYDAKSILNTAGIEHQQNSG